MDFLADPVTVPRGGHGPFLLVTHNGEQRHPPRISVSAPPLERPGIRSQPCAIYGLLVTQPSPSTSAMRQARWETWGSVRAASRMSVTTRLTSGSTRSLCLRWSAGQFPPHGLGRVLSSPGNEGHRPRPLLPGECALLHEVLLLALSPALRQRTRWVTRQSRLSCCAVTPPRGVGRHLSRLDKPRGPFESQHGPPERTPGLGRGGPLGWPGLGSWSPRPSQWPLSHLPETVSQFPSGGRPLPCERRLGVSKGLGRVTQNGLSRLF